MDSIGQRVTDARIRHDILQQIRIWWGKFERNIFPGPKPVSIERAHLPVLQESFYWVCAKTDGVRYIFACLTLENKYWVVMVNRKSDMFLLDFELPIDAYKGTVLDGEFIVNKHGLYEFAVYDCVIYNGISQMQECHYTRIKAAESICFSIKTNSKNSRKTSIHVHTKVFYPFSQMNHYIQFVTPFLSYTIDGYVFTPNHEPIKSGTHDTMFKWKEQHKNTVDFLIEPNYYYNPSNPKGHHQGHQPSHQPGANAQKPFVMKISKGKQLTMLSSETFLNTHNLVIQNRAIVECMYKGNHTWEGLWIRYDKNHPNSFLTYEKTLLNIQENICLHEFLD